MGYNLHIVREEKDNLITYDEVENLVKQYKELELKDEMQIKTPDGNIIRVSGTYILWKKKEFDVWWNYNRGKISSSYISDDGIEQLRKMAYKLNGKVVGDEGEEY
jgi:hypothetical protein